MKKEHMFTYRAARFIKDIEVKKGNEMHAIKRIYKILFPGMERYLKKELQNCRTVLDLGCGDESPIQGVSTLFSVGVELFEPSLEESKKKKIHSQYIKADIRKIEFKKNSFDAVLALDLIEHLSKEEGYELISKMEKWAKKKVIFFTPNGFLWQNGSDNNIWQTHKSGWNTEEFKKLGFKVYGVRGWRRLRGYKAEMKFKPKLIWIIISDLTQKVIYRFPKYAFQLFCVKTLRNS